MVKPQTLRHFRSHPKTLTQPQVPPRRYGRRQLLKQKASMELNKRRVDQAEAAKAGVEEEVQEEGEVDNEQASEESSFTRSNCKQKENNSSSALEALTDKFSIEVTNHGPDIDESGNDSAIRPTTAQSTSPNLDDSCDGDTTVEDSGNSSTSEEDLYYIEAIKSSRIGKNGKIEFLIKWEGYEKRSDLTWEPEKTLIDSAPGILREYFSGIGGRDTIGRKRKRSRSFKSNLAGGRGKTSNAKKRKMKPEPVTETQKMVWSKDEDSTTDGVVTEPKSKDAEDHEAILKTHILKESQDRIAEGKTLKPIQNSLYTSERASDLPGDGSEVKFSELHTAEQVTMSKTKATVEGVSHSEEKSEQQSFKPINEPLKGLMSASSEKPANSHSDLRGTSGSVVPSANQCVSDKISTDHKPGRQNSTADESRGSVPSGGKITVEGRARLRSQGGKSKQTKSQKVQRAGDADEVAKIP